jgi:hypothetical protein
VVPPHAAHAGPLRDGGLGQGLGVLADELGVSKIGTRAAQESIPIFDSVERFGLVTSDHMMFFILFRIGLA